MEVKPKISSELTKKTKKFIQERLIHGRIVPVTQCVICSAYVQVDHYKVSIDEPHVCQICEVFA